MTIPSVGRILLPLLIRVKDGNEHKIGDVIDLLADDMHLTQKERENLLPSGREPRFNNRVRWAKLHLKGALAIEDAGNNRFRITKRGLDILKENVKEISFAYLMRFPEYVEYRGSLSPTESTPPMTEVGSEESPEELMARSYQETRTALAKELIARTRAVTPSFFEKLVVDLILAMEYGGSRDDVIQAIKRTHDGGIDGIIKEDKLGLDVVCLQAKRWKDTVGSPIVQAFAGSLSGRKATKGILITTSTFSNDAKEFAVKTDKKIVLIDGDMLVQLMIDYGIGVTDAERYVLKRIDSDYFEE